MMPLKDTREGGLADDPKPTVTYDGKTYTVRSHKTGIPVL
jgi:hypothetical protein